MAHFAQVRRLCVSDTMTRRANFIRTWGTRGEGDGQGVKASVVEGQGGCVAADEFQVGVRGPGF